MSTIKNWPKYLKQYRSQHSLTQRQLAERLETPLRTLENWEGGINDPPEYLKKALDLIAIKKGKD